jgi:hypothetical protein
VKLRRSNPDVDFAALPDLEHFHLRSEFG